MNFLSDETKLLDFLMFSFKSHIETQIRKYTKDIIDGI